MTDELLRIDGLHVGFRSGDEMRPVVRGVDLRIAAGEVVGLVGESGSGKSMTALALMRLLPPGGAVTSGRIVFKGRDLRECSTAEINALRGSQIGMIFQDPLTALNPAITIGRQLTDTTPRASGVGTPGGEWRGRRSCWRWWAFLIRGSGCWRIRMNCRAACVSG